MAFTLVSWTNGDTITEVKLDQMVENERLAYYAAEAVQVLTADELTHASSSSTPFWGLFVDGVQLGADLSTTGDNVLADLDISGLTTGIHEIDIRWLTTKKSGTFKFYKSPVFNRLTVWLTASKDGPPITTHTASDITVLMHIEDHAWT